MYFAQGSNSPERDQDEMVREEDLREVRCSRCRGSGLVEVQDQETDCIDCEGFGSILI